MRLRFGHALHAAIFLTGFVAFGYELVLQGAAVTVVGSGQVAMAIVISMFILGYMTGRPIGALSDRLDLRRNLLLFALLEVAVGLLLLAALPLVAASPEVADALGAVWPFSLLSEYVRILLVLSLAAFLAPAFMGGEIPLAIKIASQLRGKDAAAEVGRTAGGVWSADALGAAAGGLATGLWLAPLLGRAHAMLLLAGLALLAGLLPLLAWRLADAPPARPRRRALPLGVVAGFLALLCLAGTLLAKEADDAALRYQYEGRLLHHETSRHAEIVVTDHPALGRTLWLDGQLQTSVRDEFQYHEPLALLPLAAHPAPARVAILGGGDGGALRQVLRDRAVEEAHLVDLDERVVAVSRAWLPEVSGGAFDDPRVRLVHQDAWAWLRAREPGSLDVILVDLPDPSFDAVALLYTREFYASAHAALAPGGVLVTQAGSPFETPELTASVRRTVASVFGDAGVYESMVWSYGTWAFVAAAKDAPLPTATPPAQAEAAWARLSPPPRQWRPASLAAHAAMGDDPLVEEAEGQARVSTVDRPVTMNPWRQQPAAPPDLTPRWALHLLLPLALAGAGLLVLRRIARGGALRAA